MAGNLTDVTDNNFQAEVLESDKPVLVDFWAAWCGPCRVVAPVLEEIASERDDLRIVKLDVDANQQTAANYEVLSIPTHDPLQERPGGQEDHRRLPQEAPGVGARVRAQRRVARTARHADCRTAPAAPMGAGAVRVPEAPAAAPSAARRAVQLDDVGVDALEAELARDGARGGGRRAGRARRRRGRPTRAAAAPRRRAPSRSASTARATPGRAAARGRTLRALNGSTVAVTERTSIAWIPSARRGAVAAQPARSSSSSRRSGPPRSRAASRRDGVRARGGGSGRPPPCACRPASGRARRAPARPRSSRAAPRRVRRGRGRRPRGCREPEAARPAGAAPGAGGAKTGEEPAVHRVPSVASGPCAFGRAALSRLVRMTRRGCDRELRRGVAGARDEDPQLAALDRRRLARAVARRVLDARRERLAGDIGLVHAGGVEQLRVAARASARSGPRPAGRPPCARSGPRGRPRGRGPRGAARRRARARARPRASPRARAGSPRAGASRASRSSAVSGWSWPSTATPTVRPSRSAVADVRGVERRDRGRDLRHRLAEARAERAVVGLDLVGAELVGLLDEAQRLDVELLAHDLGEPLDRRALAPGGDDDGLVQRLADLDLRLAARADSPRRTVSRATAIAASRSASRAPRLGPVGQVHARLGAVEVVVDLVGDERRERREQLRDGDEAVLQRVERGAVALPEPPARAAHVPVGEVASTNAAIARPAVVASNASRRSVTSATVALRRERIQRSRSVGSRRRASARCVQRRGSCTCSTAAAGTGGRCRRSRRC